MKLTAFLLAAALLPVPPEPPEEWTAPPCDIGLLVSMVLLPDSWPSPASEGSSIRSSSGHILASKSVQDPMWELLCPVMVAWSDAQPVTAAPLPEDAVAEVPDCEGFDALIREVLHPSSLAPGESREVARNPLAFHSATPSLRLQGRDQVECPVMVASAPGHPFRAP